MHWLTIAYSMTAAACVTLAAMHLLVWFKQPAGRAHLAFAATAISVAAIIPFEALMARAQTIEQSGTAIRWIHLPGALLTFSLVWFLWVHFRTGRLWLACAACGLRVMALILDFSLTPNINYREITGLRQVPLLGGEHVSVAVGVVSPWSLIALLSTLLLFLYMLDGSVRLWRRGDRNERHRAVVVGGSMVFFTLMVGGQVALVLAGFIAAPIFLGFPFLAIVAAMAYELSLDLAKAGQLSLEVKAEHRLAEEAKNNLAAIVESSNDAILSKKLDGTIISWNAGAEKMYGYTANEMVARHVSTLAPADLNGEVPEILERIKRGEHVDHLETVRVTKEGRRIDVSLTISPIRDESRLIIGASIIARDITRRKLAELEVLRQRSELAHLSRQTMLGELSGSIAHELNQPLGAILRNTEAAELFLQDPAPDLEELRAILADIREDDQRAGAVIDRMRSMLKRREVEHSLLDLTVLVSEVISLVQPDADLRKVRLALRAGSSLPPVRGDRVQLQQVLLNLLLNAMDAVNGSAPDRRLVTLSVQLAGTSIDVAVSDTGHGIPADKLICLFEPFFTTKPNGMGLGLPISRTIMEAHGGSIRGENHSEGGAAFYFTLPVAKEESVS